MSTTYPVNQVFLGSNSFTDDSIESKLTQLKAYEEKLKSIRDKSSIPENSLWNTIDGEITPLTQDQKEALFNNEDYIDINMQLQSLVQTELLNLVKSKIENSTTGNQLLNTQLNVIKTLKTNIIQESNKELELFKKFKDFSKNNSEVTYEDFIKSNM